ncbi:MAG: phosphoenolpyruvate--protein phosphotransferase [Lachnospiraceae bacterium]|nr:phosphoenolpyruvate--protein phosphotransferase [Lachnospiraceae bacterium]
MTKYSGKIAFGGIAIGEIVEFEKPDRPVRRIHTDDTDEETVRFNNAVKCAEDELTALYDKAVAEVGETNAAIFEVHKMMLADDDYLDAVINIIRQQEVNAEYAVAVTSDNFSVVFSSMEDEYMKERAADIKDISNRLIGILSGKSARHNNFAKPVIIVADDLTPSETVQLDKDMVLAFVTRKGSTNSHTAILARTMNIPAIVSSDIGEVKDGTMCVVDGFNGEIIIEPDDAITDEYRKKQAAEEERMKELMKLKSCDSVTKSGKKVNLYANIGGVNDVAAVLQNGAEGIGLFRSEFLYLESDDYPTEESQFNAYKTVAEMMGGKPVIIRTLDIGADKQIGYFDIEQEENPALGYRAIRICLDRPEIFETQLRALYRASAFGNVSIMIPMITSLWEIKKVREIAENVKKQLEEKGVPYGNPEIGVMIETPAAVMIAEELAEEVDFFSIGTNDLTQYVLAIDRQNESLEKYYDAHHPAVLKMIEMTVKAGHKAGIWVGICGELGADTTLTEQFINMGVDELSVSPGVVLKVRKKIMETE